MREIQASEAKTHLLQLLGDVERGETIIITRHGRAIGRIVPEAHQPQADVDSRKNDGGGTSPGSANCASLRRTRD
jgi:prevent-host-death family protein